MKIAIDTADLDCERIDGTRVYIQNVLKYLGRLAPEDEFFLFHKTEYNKLLRPAEFKNYHDKSLGKGFWWTQIKFAREVRKLNSDVCWMPIQQIPGLNFQFSIFNFQSIFNDLILNFKLIFNVLILNKRKNDRRAREINKRNNTEARPRYSEKVKYVVTIHDLAFKFFGNHFPLVDRIKLNWYTDVAVKRADKIIAISEATKKDLIKFYPEVDENKIVVVRHGFDRENFEQEFSEREKKVFAKKYNLIKKEVGENAEIQNSKFKIQNYLLYVGAIQPRKDLVTLIKAFDKIKSQDARSKIQTNLKIQGTRYKQMTNDKLQMTNDKLQMTNDETQINDGLQAISDVDVSNLKLVLVGEKAWKSESTLRAIDKSEFKDDIIVTGKVDFRELAMFYRFAKVFVFPSLYEGFGIPILEAMASKTPVIVADNSSLTEVGGEAVLKFKTGSSDDLQKQLRKLLEDKNLQDKIVGRGLEQIKKFSWEKCARETLEILRGM